MLKSGTKLPKNDKKIKKMQIESFTFEVGTYLLHETYFKCIDDLEHPQNSEFSIEILCALIIIYLVITVLLDERMLF